MIYNKPQQIQLFPCQYELKGAQLDDAIHHMQPVSRPDSLSRWLRPRPIRLEKKFQVLPETSLDGMAAARANWRPLMCLVSLIHIGGSRIQICSSKRFEVFSYTLGDCTCCYSFFLSSLGSAVLLPRVAPAVQAIPRIPDIKAQVE